MRNWTCMFMTSNSSNDGPKTEVVVNRRSEHMRHMKPQRLVSQRPFCDGKQSAVKSPFENMQIVLVAHSSEYQ